MFFVQRYTFLWMRWILFVDTKLIDPLRLLRLWLLRLLHSVLVLVVVVLVFGDCESVRARDIRTRAVDWVSAFYLLDILEREHFQDLGDGDVFLFLWVLAEVSRRVAVPNESGLCLVHTRLMLRTKCPWRCHVWKGLDGSKCAGWDADSQITEQRRHRVGSLPAEPSRDNGVDAQRQTLVGVGDLFDFDFRLEDQSGLLPGRGV